MPLHPRPSRSARSGLLALALLATAWILPAAASAQTPPPGPSVTPTTVAGNPSCKDLGYANELKDDSPQGGSSYPIGNGGFLVIDVTYSDDQKFVDFDSTWGLDAVIVKGADAANAYVYNTPQDKDFDLRSPSKNGGIPEISHVSFCYRPHGRFRIVKDAEPDTGEDFGFTTSKPADGTAIDPSFTLDDDAGADATLSNSWESGWVAVGDYSVTEGTTSGWQLDSISCAYDKAAAERGIPSPPATISGATATISVKANESITCVYTNVPVPPGEKGTVRIKKLTDPDTSTATFDFVAGTGVTNIDDLGHGDTSDAQEVAAGTYEFSESQLEGWDMTNVDCDDADSTGSTDPPSATEAGTISFVVAPGEDVLCTVTNTQNGTIVVEKQTDPDETDGTAFAFSTTAPGGGFSLADDGVVQRSVTPGSYTVTEGDAAGYTLSGIACGDGGAGDVGTRTATYTVSAGETVSCVFTNKKDPAPAVTRTPDPTPTPTPIVAAAQSLAPAPAPQRQVAASRRASPGSARLLGPSGCATRPFTVRIRGSQIRSVVISVGNRRIRTLRGRAGSSVLSVRIDPRTLRRGQVHRVTARVTFTTASGTRARTLRVAFQRCRQSVTPKFTG